MEGPMHENPEWEKARQALASISKANAAASGNNKNATTGPANAQVRVFVHGCAARVCVMDSRSNLRMCRVLWVSFAGTILGKAPY